MRGRVVELWKTEHSLAVIKGAGKRHLPLPSPSRNPKGKQFLSLNMLVPCKHLTLCFCGSIVPKGLPASLPVLQGPSNGKAR